MARPTENYVSFIGFIGKDPIVTLGTEGKRDRASFSLATSTRWKEGDEPKERTEWHDITAFGKLATEVVAKLGRQGAYVRVKGSLQHRRVEGDEGTRYYTNVVADEFFLLDKRESDNDEAAGDQA